MERVTDKKYWMDSVLKSNLNTALYNLNKDWDFVFIISGSGMVRLGKSVIAQQVAYYIAYNIDTPFGIDNIVFDGQTLIDMAHKLPKNSVIIYDEARGELDSKKVMENVTKTLLDFFAECGMYNHFIILVLPDFFELPKSIAIHRSDALINLWRHAETKKLSDGIEVLEYKRGYFEFYGRKPKRDLYIKGKKADNTYSVGKRNFWGEFRDFWIVDKKEYEKKKITFLQRQRSKDRKAQQNRFAIALKVLSQHFSQRQISIMLKEAGLTLSYGRINQIINGLPEIKQNKAT